MKQHQHLFPQSSQPPQLKCNLPLSNHHQKAPQPKGEHIKEDKGKEALYSEEAEKESTDSDPDKTYVTGSMVEPSRKKKLKKFDFITEDGRLSPLSLSFDFVFFSSEIFKSLSFRLDRLCHLAILCLDQHVHTLHHLESLLTNSLDILNIFDGRSCISEFVRKSLSLILKLS
ncbi:hypothetical protein Tco_1259347 [Tanacetum coccineum]